MKLQLSDQEYRDLLALGRTITSDSRQDDRPVGCLADRAPSGLQAMLKGGWSEAAEAERRHRGVAMAALGECPAELLAPISSLLEDAVKSRVSSDGLALLMKAAIVDLQALLEGFAGASRDNLRRALGMALEANLALRQFARVASHDLKTPLGTVANLCEETLDEFGDDLAPAARKLIEAARDRALQTSRAIDNALDQATHQDFTGSGNTILLTHVLADAERRIRLQFPTRALELETAGSLPSVVGDSLRLREAIYQILGAILVASEQPVTVIRVMGERRGKEAILQLEIAGPTGLVSQCDRLFHPFAGSSRIAGTAGSSVGLYFAKVLVEQQGGHIDAQPLEMSGLEVVISLPATAS